MSQIQTKFLADNAVTSAKIPSSAVTTAKIADANVTDVKLGTGINANKLADGSVSNTEFQYLGNVTSDIQTQFSGKEPTITTLSIAKGGTNSGSALSNNRVMQSSSGSIVEAAAITAARALISDANGIPVHSAVTSTELGYVSGVTSAIQTQLNALAGGSGTNLKQLFTLSGTDITNQYIDLSQVAKTDSIHFIVKGGAPTIEGASHDYSVSYTGGAGGKTRVTFLNDLATGGAAALIATDVIQVQYEY